MSFTKNGYTYNVLNQFQVRSLDRYLPGLTEISFSRLMDETLTVSTLGMLSGNITVEGSVTVGGGYGDTGWTADSAGNTQQDGVADFSVGGLLIPYGTLTSTSPGSAGNLGCDADYLYVCYASDVWARIPLTDKGPF